jgi:hypothetical protein
MIDRSLNYGRHHIKAFLESCLPFETVLDIGAGKGDDLTLASVSKSNLQAKYMPTFRN